MCLPVTNQISEVFAGADQQAIVALLAKMGKYRMYRFYICIILHVSCTPLFKSDVYQIL